jgi:hypothetical protein
VGALAGSNHHISRSGGGEGALGGAGHGGALGGAGNPVVGARVAEVVPGGMSHDVHVAGSGWAGWEPGGAGHLATGA